MKNDDLNTKLKNHTFSLKYGNAVSEQKNEIEEMVPKKELHSRAEKLRTALTQAFIGWGALILDSLTMYYFTGTMQQGVVVIPVEKDLIFFVS